MMWGAVVVTALGLCTELDPEHCSASALKMLPTWILFLGNIHSKGDLLTLPVSG